jgi:hypothetical protein
MPSSLARPNFGNHQPPYQRHVGIDTWQPAVAPPSAPRVANHHTSARSTAGQTADPMRGHLGARSAAEADASVTVLPPPEDFFEPFIPRSWRRQCRPKPDQQPPRRMLAGHSDYRCSPATVLPGKALTCGHLALQPTQVLNLLVWRRPNRWLYEAGLKRPAVS